MIKASGAFFSTKVRVTFVFRCTFTFNWPNSAIRLEIRPPNSLRPGSFTARLTCPPSLLLVSQSVTLCPDCAATTAAFSPAGPPPAINTFFKFSDIIGFDSLVSRPDTGC